MHHCHYWILGLSLGLAVASGCDTKKGSAPPLSDRASTGTGTATGGSHDDRNAAQDACVGLEGEWAIAMKGEAPCAGSFFADKVSFRADKDGFKWNLSAESGGWGVAESKTTSSADEGCVVELVLSRGGEAPVTQVAFTIKDGSLAGAASHSDVGCSSKAELSGNRK